MDKTRLINDLENLADYIKELLKTGEPPEYPGLHDRGIALAKTLKKHGPEGFAERVNAALNTTDPELTRLVLNEVYGVIHRLKVQRVDEPIDVSKIKKIYEPADSQADGQAATDDTGGEQAGQAAGGEQINLDSHAYEVLKYLGENQGRLCVQVEIEQNRSITRKTIGEKLKLLMDNGLAAQPRGPRQGYAITPQGREFLDRCSPPPPQ